MNQYQQNIDIIKEFFKRKLIIIYAISITLPIFFFVNIADLPALFGNVTSATPLNDSAASFDISSGFTSSYGLFVIEILFAVIFLLFFVKSASEESSLKVPVGMFRVVSLINFIITAFVSLALVFVVLFTSLYIMSEYTVLISILIVPFLFALVPVVLLLSLSQMLLAQSVKTSINSIYLKKNGAKLFGITNIAAAFLSLYFTVLWLIFNVGGASRNLIPATLFLVFTALKYTLGAIVGLKYAKYIETYSSNTVTQNNEEKPDENLSVIICKNCGKPLTSDDYFCNHCGTPVEK